MLIYFGGFAYLAGFGLTMRYLVNREWKTLGKTDDTVDFFMAGLCFMAFSLLWPLTMLAHGIVALGMQAKVASVCQDCRGLGKTEGIGGRSAACIKCGGEGRVLESAYKLRKRRKNI
jgi:hypothetical protein